MTVSDERLAYMLDRQNAGFTSLTGAEFTSILTELQSLRAIPRGGVSVERYQCREIGEGDWEDCSKEKYDRLALDPHHDTRILSAIEQEQEPVAELTHDIGVWQLVPVRPTDRMIEAGKSADDEFLAEPPGFYATEEIYKAMIEAAPKAPFTPDLLSPSVCEGKVTEVMVEQARAPGAVTGHPSIAPRLAAGEWPSWAEIDAFAAAAMGDPLAEKIIRAAHGGMMHGPQGLRLLYDIRHAMGWSDLHGLDIMPSGIADMRKSYLWNPIEWAPKDGTHVLVKFDGTSTPPTVAHWFADAAEPGWYLSVQQSAGPAIHPTHWQRLPAERAS